MRRWIGRALMGIAAVHLAFGLVVFWAKLAEIAARGVFNSVGTDPEIGAVVWFVLFSAPFYLLGLLVDEMEKRGQQLPKTLGWGLLAMAVLGVVLMPDSGFWLVLPVGFALLRRVSG
jgi:hypothetical protein